MNTRISLLAALFCLALQAMSQALPSASPTMTYDDEDGFPQEETTYDGGAPLTARFAANLTDVGNYTALVEWRFCEQGVETPFLTRFDEETEYTFKKSGSFTVELRASFILDGDTIDFTQDEAFVITIRESKLEFPNAFTPNGDGINDVFRAKDGFESIVSFKAMVFNRWGKKLYEWNDPAGGWDGDGAPDGAYYLNVDAKGADGRHYKIRKTINLLRGYIEGI